MSQPFKRGFLALLLAASVGVLGGCDNESRGNDFKGAKGDRGDDGRSFDQDQFCMDNPDNVICTDDLDTFCEANPDRLICDNDLQEFCSKEENAERAICLDPDALKGEDFDLEQFCADNPANPICGDLEAFCSFEDEDGNRPNENKAVCVDSPDEPAPRTGGLIFNVQETTAGLLGGTILEPVNDGLNLLVDPEDGVLSPLTGQLEALSDDGAPLAPLRDGVNTLIVQEDSLRVVIDSLNAILKILDPSALGDLPGGFDFPFDVPEFPF